MGVVTVPVSRPGLVGVLCAPDAPGPHPAVLVVGGSEGSVPEFAARALAGEGFAALAVAYFGTGPLPPDLVEIPVEYFTAAVDWLAGRPEADVDRLAVLGRSRGGELALLLAASYPELVRAVVAYVPSSVVWQAVPSDPRAMMGPARSSWRHGGEPVPFVPMLPPTPADAAEFMGFLRGQPVSFRSSFERALSQEAEVAAASIPVERINGPVLVLSGGEDRLWPSVDFGERIVSRLTRHGHRYACRHLSFPEAGHLLGVPGTALRPRRPGFDRIMMGGDPETDEKASSACWPAVVDFLTAV
ncbi:acyl-CoA thioester hydrolase/BAAT C-terminal domain-containing protein [Amycolatopsis suaedae]|uniref:Alpha/beta fold hydrolase n=1 Tax=Amycolatopsis suaedae TaxID=2510978 RepID=A0A4Q7J8C2_9PSEU|nr:acyl-CoA thioester hydrolase/BAAT C-terminal domain-containing protein [Amycolatopsis suaedae]RZQ63940.1 alpha/beta fold hydrolase [Amycolatopsis suaedae]